MDAESKERLDDLVRGVCEIIAQADDDDIFDLLGDGILQELLDAVAKPKGPEDGSVYEYLLKNKQRLSLLALLRLAIQRNFSTMGIVEGQKVFVSPHHVQYDDDGVTFVQGKERFTGLLGLYKDGEIRIAVAARAIEGGESVTKDDFLFVDVDEAKQRMAERAVPDSLENLHSCVAELEKMLDDGETRESQYQEFLERNPWIFGSQYRSIGRHDTFDDANIPDFTGIRVHDDAHDIIEIKQPFLSLFRQDDEFSADFNAAWNQAERYLDFAQRESDYLHRQKEMKIDQPRCFLVLGFGLTDTHRSLLRRKERLNPSITIYTYEDLVVLAKATVDFYAKLKAEAE